MYYYSKKSRNKVIHTVECFHIHNTDIDDLGWFESLSEAYKYGYRLCRHCNLLSKDYRNEKKQIIDYCRVNGLSLYLTYRSLMVESIKSKWQITLDKKDKFVLYHKNTFETYKDCLSEIGGYHFQRDIRANSVMEYLKYIIEHDYYRQRQPICIEKKKREKPLPKKGTKRYRKAQNRIKKFERKQAIRNVIDIIDSLNAPSAEMQVLVV